MVIKLKFFDIQGQQELISWKALLWDGCFFYAKISYNSFHGIFFDMTDVTWSSNKEFHVFKQFWFAFYFSFENFIIDRALNGSRERFDEFNFYLNAFHYLN